MARLGGGGAATEKAPKPVKAAKTAAVRPAAKAKPTGGSFVGLDIGTQTIKAVEVKGSGRSLTVTALGMVNTPPGAIQQGIVTDPKALGAAIKSLVSKNGIKAGKTVSAAAGADGVIVRVIELPRMAMTPGEFAETMKWEIERNIPFAANEVETSFQAIDDPASADTSNPNMDVLFAAARKDMIGLHLDTLNASGLKPFAIDIEPLAVGRALIDLSGKGLNTKNVVTVNIGASLTEVAIFKDGLLRFPRTIPLAGDNFTRAIADGLGLTIEAAEDEKRQYATVLMELLNTGGATGNPFDEPAAGAAGSPFDFDFETPASEAPIPPAFGTITPGEPVSAMPTMGANVFDLPESDTPVMEPVAATNDPFGTAAAFDPFGNTEATAQATPPPAAAVAVPAPVPSDPNSARKRQIFDALLPILGEFSMELRRSIDYFRSRYPSDTIDQIILCGGSAALRNLDQYIQSDLGIATVVADPFAGLTLASKQLSREKLAEVAPAFAVAVGLAARDAVIGS